jgi:hypothetical protein
MNRAAIMSRAAHMNPAALMNRVALMNRAIPPATRPMPHRLHEATALMPHTASRAALVPHTAVRARRPHDRGPNARTTPPSS